MKLFFWGRLWRFIFVNPLPFALNIFIKDCFLFIYFLSPVMCSSSLQFLEKLVISLPWKKTCRYGYAIILLRLWGIQMPSLLTFSIFFKLQQIMDLDVLRSSANFQVLLIRLHSINSLKAFWSRSDEYPGLSSSLNDISPERNFEDRFQTWW